jgi:hypothetical protein
MRTRECLPVCSNIIFFMIKPQHVIRISTQGGLKSRACVGSHSQTTTWRLLCLLEHARSPFLYTHSTHSRWTWLPSLLASAYMQPTHPNTSPTHLSTQTPLPVGVASMTSTHADLHTQTLTHTLTCGCGQHDTVRLDACDVAALLVALNVGQKGGRAPINNQLIQHLLHLSMCGMCVCIVCVCAMRIRAQKFRCTGC